MKKKIKTLALITVTVAAVKAFERVNNKNWLQKDIQEFKIETDNEKPKRIATINETLNPEDDYRIRVKFN